MEIKPGLSALVTGGASGIGRALCLALAEKGVFVTVVDFSEEKGKETTSLVQKANAPFHPSLNSPSAIFVKCDVTNRGDLVAAFEKHLATFGTLDICINNAGISNPLRFDKDDTDGSKSWRHTINVDLVAVVECTQLAIKAMKAKQKPGVIINMGSAAGLYPMTFDPIYSAAKGGVVLFTRSLAYFKRQGIRINVLCPEFIQTDLAEGIGVSFLQSIGGYMPMDMLIKGAFELITDESKAGACLWISNRRGLEYWPTPMEQAKYLVASSSRKKTSFKVTSAIELPQSFEKIIVHALSHNFRNATSIVRTPLKLPIGPQQVLLKIIYAGVNASDVNFSSGRYFSGGSPKLPFDAGFEGVGLIAAMGESVKNLQVGTPAAVMTFGAYAEYMIVSAKHVLPVPRPDPEVVAMLTSGLTALTALEKAGQMKSGETVLVTAAAGGTGQFAVQIAKLAGYDQPAAEDDRRFAPSLMEALTTSRVVPLQVTCRKLSSSLSADFSCLEFKRYPCTSGRVSIMNHPNLLLRPVSASLQPQELSALGHEGNVAPSKEILELWRDVEAVCFDVDSTVCVDEGIDELAEFCGAGKAVAEWTARAMGGSVPFEEALAARLSLFKPSLSKVEEYLAKRPPRLSPGIEELVKKLRANKIDVYLISGGFRQMINPVASILGIPRENIFANNILFGNSGEFVGFDENEPTSRSGGKAKAVQQIRKGRLYKTMAMIGDGATDLEARKPGGADLFICYAGVQLREAVAAQADWLIFKFEPLINSLDSVPLYDD